jgi:hypothetical protein
MDFPKRDIAHIKEKAGLELVSACLPDEWIVRELTERDYGVDLYLEITRDGSVTGDLAALQVKGTATVKLRPDGTATFPGIKKTTFHYWTGLPVPVFLMVGDLNAQKLYWVSVKEQARAMGPLEPSEETMSFKLSGDRVLEPKRETVHLLAFQLTYMRERRWSEIENAVNESLRLFSTLGPLVLWCVRLRAKNRKQHVSTTVQYLVTRHYKNYRLFSRYFLGERPSDLPEWYHKHRAAAKEDGVEVAPTFSAEMTVAFLDSFLNKYWTTLMWLNSLVTKEQKTYWAKADPYLFLLLTSKPLFFNQDDWWARFYFDEYERETSDLAACLFEEPVSFE